MLEDTNSLDGAQLFCDAVLVFSGLANEIKQPINLVNGKLSL